MIKDYVGFLKKGISKYKEYNDEFKKEVTYINNKIFDILFQFINSKFNYVKNADYYFKTITINENFKNELLYYITNLRNNSILKLSSLLEKEMNEIDKKITEELKNKKSKKN